MHLPHFTHPIHHRPHRHHLRSLRRRTDFIQFESYQIHTHTLSEHVLVSRLLQALLFVRKAPLIKFRVKLKDIIQMTVTFYLRFYISGVFIDTIFCESCVFFGLVQINPAARKPVVHGRLPKHITTTVYCLSTHRRQ